MTTTTTGGIEPQVPAPKKNVFSRIAGVLFAPAETFQEIARRPDIVAPLLLLIAAGFISVLLIAPRVDLESMATMQASQIRKQNPNTSAADAERAGRMMAASSKVFIWISPVAAIVIYAIFAAVFLFAFRLMGGEGTYAQAFSVTLYSWIPFAISGLITGIVVLARGSFDPMTAATLVKSNPAFLVDMREQPALFSLLSSVDVFSFWMLVLYVFGFSAMSKLSRKTSAIIVVTIWAAYVLLKVGFAAVMPGTGA
jgi:hypothetical protein